MGVVLAGGAARRFGGEKLSAALAGRPLLSWPLCVLLDQLAEVVVVAKPGIELPRLPAGVERWDEPASPRHPLVGIVEGLRRAGGRAVVVLAGDMPLVSVSTVGRLVELGVSSGACVTAVDEGGGIEPLLAFYAPTALAAIGGAAADAPLRSIVAALDPLRFPVDTRELTNVNTAADLARAEALLLRRN